MAQDGSNDWRPTASLAALAQRARLLARVRSYFAREGVLEVETPLLSHAGSTDIHLHSYAAHSLAPGDAPTSFYLHTSPEFFMKRLLAAGTGSIYQLCKVLRAGESGRRHNPEFTLLEWYRVDVGYRGLMRDVEALVRYVLEGLRSLGDSEIVTYGEAFQRYTGIDPHTASAHDFARVAEDGGIRVSALDMTDRNAWRDLLLTHLVEPNLGSGRLTFVYDYPADAAALAQIRPGNPPVAERFELYVDGIELANGFHELSNAQEQRERFERDQRLRGESGLAFVAKDERFLSALANGLPECSGVALGFDRLVMLALGVDRIDEVIAFPTDRA
jgi:elongation factor P--(R)-beta-lysine ligase